MKLFHVVGARPNFMKMAPALRAIAQNPDVEQILVHTGQHYDANMSEIFFAQLGIPAPNFNLEVGSSSHAAQTAQIMILFETLVTQHRPNIVVVYGDVNSTVAATLVCAKLGIPVAHVEAGLRSFDRQMPEEVNRVVTDQLADVLFTPSEDADENLHREGVDSGKIHLVGNLMIDTLVKFLRHAQPPRIAALNGAGYALVTLHRPSNVDQPETLRSIVRTLRDLSDSISIVFPVHPRTRQRIAEFALRPADERRLIFLEPVGYLEFLALQRDAEVVITDSGGIQEETTFLGVPCLTLRDNTERPITIDIGTNLLVGNDMERLKAETHKILSGHAKKGAIPPLWDGHAGERVAAVIAGRA